MSYVVSQVEKPKIIYTYGVEQGFGILSEALPAGKYWTCQNGITPEMLKQHEALLLSGKADFIFVKEEMLLDSSRIQKQKLIELGYKEYFQFNCQGEYALFSNKTDLDVSENATPSLKELFFKNRSHRLKRNHYE